MSFSVTDTQISWNYSFKGKTRGKVRELIDLGINMLSVDKLNAKKRELKRHSLLLVQFNFLSKWSLFFFSQERF